MSTSATTGRIAAVDYHRNGVGGVPFFVAILHEDDSRKLMVHFPPDEEAEGYQSPYTAVLDINMLAEDNIFMYPQRDDAGETIPGTGNNAWRGDRYADEYGTAIVAAWEAKHA